MSITILPNGRLRAQVYDPSTAKNVSVAKILGLPRDQATWENTRKGRREAEKARERARDLLNAQHATSRPLTVGEWYERWTSDRLFETGPKGPRKPGTLIHYHGQCRLFATAHRDVPLDGVSDEIVAAWLAGGTRNGQVASLRVMFNDAASRRAGKLIHANPFERMGIAKPSRRNVAPPSIEQVWEMLAAARRLTCPSFAAWLQVACFTGMRPGELDGLERADCDMARGRIRVRQQWNARERRLASPKNDLQRTIVMPPPAREALLELPATSRWAFETPRGNHWTASARNPHWDRVRTVMGWLDAESRTCLYTATRHFCGSYLINALGMSFEDAAVQLGHTDGGDQMRRTYGHMDTGLALARLERSFEAAAHTRERKLRAV
jgi:integrase